VLNVLDHMLAHGEAKEAQRTIRGRWLTVSLTERGQFVYGRI
jgi:hypothetical protein